MLCECLPARRCYLCGSHLGVSPRLLAAARPRPQGAARARSLADASDCQTKIKRVPVGPLQPCRRPLRHPALGRLHLLPGFLGPLRLPLIHPALLALIFIGCLFTAVGVLRLPVRRTLAQRQGERGGRLRGGDRSRAVCDDPCTRHPVRPHRVHPLLDAGSGWPPKRVPARLQRHWRVATCPRACKRRPSL